jgi:hypothetical protein
MKIKIDRRGCNCWIASCEACFGWHYLDEEVRPNYCLLEIEEDDQPGRTFVIMDRDGKEKILVVNEDNWAQAQDAWALALEAQLV